MTAYQQIQELHNLEECILEEFRFLHYQTTVSMLFNYIWAPDGGFRADMEEVLPVELRFHLVQRVDVSNGLWESVLRSPERMNWGMNEIAMFEIDEDAPMSALPANAPITFHRASALWEKTSPERRIDIEFAWLEILGPGIVTHI